jgi:RNA polymerase sigma-70 factor (ECF subfamily)
MTNEPNFDELIRPLILPGYRLALTMLGEREAAEDAVQEASVRAWKNANRLRDRAAAESWFLAIVANQCRTARRRRWFSVLKFAEPAVERHRDEDTIDARIDLDRALDRLNQDDRLALYLHFYMDMTFEDAARVMGISMTAARSRTYRALERLRPHLAPSMGVYADV